MKTWSTNDLIDRADATLSKPNGGGATGAAPGVVGGLINLTPAPLPTQLMLSFGAPAMVPTTLILPVA